MLTALNSHRKLFSPKVGFSNLGTLTNNKRQAARKMLIIIS